MCDFCVTVHNDDITLIYMVSYSYFKNMTSGREFFISKKDASRWGDKKTQQAHQYGKQFYFEIEERILN